MFTAERSPTAETSHLFKNPKKQICPHNLQTVMSPPTLVVSEPRAGDPRRTRTGADGPDVGC